MMRRRVFLGVGDLVVGDDVRGDVAVGDLAASKVGVLQAQHGLHVGQREPVAVQLRGIDFDAHGGQCAAAHNHLPTP